jgi:F-type H+-transporting ATPase subunit b
MEQLGIDTRLLIAQLINYLAFFIIFQQFVAKPFLNFVKQQRKAEKEKEETMTKLQEGEKAMQQREKEFEEKAKEQMETMITEAKEDAEKVREELISEAKKEADDILQKTKKQIAEEREQMQEDIKKQAVDLSVTIVQKALSTYLTGEAQKKVTDHIVTKLGKEAHVRQN